MALGDGGEGRLRAMRSLLRRPEMKGAALLALGTAAEEKWEGREES
jgi:hypothetical protein